MREGLEPGSWGRCARVKFRGADWVEMKALSESEAHWRRWRKRSLNRSRVHLGIHSMNSHLVTLYWAMGERQRSLHSWSSQPPATSTPYEPVPPHSSPEPVSCFCQGLRDGGDGHGVWWS